MKGVWIYYSLEKVSVKAVSADAKVVFIVQLPAATDEVLQLI